MTKELASYQQQIEKALAKGNATEHTHRPALKTLIESLAKDIIPLAYVRGLPRAQTLAFSQRVINASDIEIVWVDEALHRQGLALVQTRPDKSYSLCDAVSLALRRDRGLQEALTMDRHFEQEGFIKLLTA